MGKAMTAAAAVLAGVAVFAVVVLAAITGTEGSSSTAAATVTAVQTVEADSMCTATGPLKGLSKAEAGNAETIVSVTDTLSHENRRAAQIALMTALTESGLVNVDGGAGGAYGLFQQTPPAWGTVREIMTPAYAATQFVTHLLAIRGWQHVAPWEAAQQVQRSGAGQPDSPINPLPGVVGGNYKVNWGKAAQVLDLVVGSATAADCGGGPSGGVAGPAGAHGLPAGYKVPAGTTPSATLAIDYAISKLGDAYVWGAAGPNAFDCSGLTMMAWKQAGVQLAHYTVDQEHEGTRVPAARIVPGDLVFIPGSDAPGRGLPGHVGIYLGDSLVLSAIDVAQGVAVQSWRTFVGGGLDAVVDPAV